MALSGKEKEQLNEVILSAYNEFEFKQFLDYKLNQNVDHITLGGSFAQIVYEVIAYSERHGWTEDLIHELHDDRPRNEKVKAFTGQSLKYRGSRLALEKVIQKTNGFIDVNQWRTKLARIERQVCSIQIGADHAGTGFLIAHDLVMTNYHVVNTLLGESPRHKPEQVRVRFDYRKSSDGNDLNEGVSYKLDVGNWMVDYSKYSQVDGKETSQLPSEDELDYAILRVAPRNTSEGGVITPGKEPALGSHDDQRGWIELPKSRKDIVVNYPLFIVQHPKGAPLKMALDTDGIAALNGNETRFRYTTNTEPGSSGSPCFNSDWDLIGLHHMGDPDSELPMWNQGIPVYTIRKRLERIGKLDVVLHGAAANTGGDGEDDLLDEVEGLLGNI